MPVIRKLLENRYFKLKKRLSIKVSLSNKNYFKRWLLSSMEEHVAAGAVLTIQANIYYVSIPHSFSLYRTAFKRFSKFDSVPIL